MGISEKAGCSTLIISGLRTLDGSVRRLPLARIEAYQKPLERCVPARYRK
jgi:hypothetical protein